MLKQMEETNQQQSSQFTRSKQTLLIFLVIGIVVVAIIFGSLGYMLGKSSLNKTASITPQQALPLATPMHTPPPSSSEVPTTSGWQPTPLKSTQGLPFIASAVIDYVLKHQPSLNPQISFTQNDGMYAQGLLGD